MPAAARARSIAISGTMPEPPATRNSGPSVSAPTRSSRRSGPRSSTRSPIPNASREIRRHLAVIQALDGDGECGPRRLRRDRVASLGLVSVLCRQPDVHVLAGAVARPARDVEHERLRVRRLADDLYDGGAATRSGARTAVELAARPSRVAGVALLAPRVAVVVIAEHFPEPGLVVRRELRCRAPISRSSRNRDAARGAAPGRRARVRAACHRSRTRPTPCRR